MEDHSVLRVRERPEGGPFPGVDVVHDPQGIVGMGGKHDGIERVAGATLGPDGHPEFGPRDVHDRIAGTDCILPDPIDDPLDVGHRAADDRPPLQRSADADQPVVIQEAQEVVDRKVEDPVGRRGPHRGRDGDQEVVLEPRTDPEILEIVS